MSLLGALDSALSGMRATQVNVQTVSNNLANAGDANYTRKTVTQQAIVGGGDIGGVKISGYGRVVSNTLNRAYNTAISEQGLTDAQVGYFSQIKDLYGVSTDSTALGNAVTNFGNAWQSLTAAPEDVTQQNQVITTGNALANEIKRLSAGVESLDRQVQQDTKDGVQRVNDLLKTVTRLNAQIANGQGTGQATGDLEDQRDTAVREISKFVAVQQLPAELGAVRLLTNGGLTLLDAQGQTLVYDGSTIRNTQGDDLGSLLKGGSFEAMLNIRADHSPGTASTESGTEVIRKLRDQLATVADNFLSTAGTPASFAAAYNGAATKTGVLAGGFFTGSDQFTISVNASLMSGAAVVKTASAQPVSTAINADSRTINASGISTTSKSYFGFVSGIVSAIGLASTNVSERSSVAATTAANYKERVGNTSGVNVDEELVRLTQLQNSYAASARVITTVKDLFDTLDSVLR